MGTVLRPLTSTLIDEAFSNNLHLFIGASMDSTADSTAVAGIIISVGCDCVGRLPYQGVIKDL